ncbi:DNA-3-methyladenine glycosylase [Borreliella spielmanii]|uniref:Putative 3-methyladenine DNA glycosylase n=3 Tax=Borreliella spielmanii TaxID=88916 RepID=B9X8S7_9SPIR|nr:DNA-3-methyladenine glycosylase [Borreliella spielmanii]EEF84273.1 DNA-3-methyladenine glycosylase [Borreliella spielmanii A14S]MBB6031443.1 DNA-3-methyladenine glycosylase [Borreliella spielmanii]WKC83502.1 DNA-3-methyladenine glycosylase [Borreliella spielmanii]
MDRYFFLEDATTVAKLLLGNLLIRKINKKEIVVRIVETEAYMGITDSACHSYGGKRTNRTNAMYSIGGYSYVYMIYGVHYMFNIVTADKNNPQAVLIRSVEPISPFLEGKGILTNGPGKLTKFLNIDLTFNKVDLIGNNELFLQKSFNLDFNIVCSKRININYAQKDDINKFWRFYIKDNKFVSRR